jgi:hypothetical protein
MVETLPWWEAGEDGPLERLVHGLLNDRPLPLFGLLFGLVGQLLGALAALVSMAGGRDGLNISIAKVGSDSCAWRRRRLPTVKRRPRRIETVPTYAQTMATISRQSKLMSRTAEAERGGPSSGGGAGPVKMMSRGRGTASQTLRIATTIKKHRKTWVNMSQLLEMPVLPV